MPGVERWQEALRVNNLPVSVNDRAGVVRSMDAAYIRNLDNIKDLSGPIEIADRIWWVGHYLEGDPFQCHCYLIEQGDQSVLIDPGSKLTFEHSLAKIEQVVPFCAIKYFVCQHQDPDVAGAMPIIDEMIERDDAVLVTHWRAHLLLKHYGLKIPFWLIDQNDWQLQLQDRLLRFVLTPYAHFPGAFVSFDVETAVVFSGDLFGGFGENHQLVAQDEGHFEVMRPFHEHYMPSKEVLGYAMLEIEALQPKLIAPQHGSLIPEFLIKPMISKLMNLDCGLYLLAYGDTDIHKLSRLNQTLKDITHTMLLSREFREIADRLTDIIGRDLPVSVLEYYALFVDQHILHFSPETRYQGVKARQSEETTQLLGKDRTQWTDWVDACGGIRGEVLKKSEFCLLNGEHSAGPALVIPLIDPDMGKIQAVAIIGLSEEIQVTGQLEQVMLQLTMPLTVAIEREVIYRKLDKERMKLYERSIHDPLTGLFSRIYMHDTVQRLCDIQDRKGSDPVAALLLDIDDFKQVNDTYGHNQGDEVLRQVSALILETTRDGDIPVRLGGEEFIIFVTAREKGPLLDSAERLRQQVAAMKIELLGGMVTVTISIGTAIRDYGEALESLIERADRALYQAKRNGRNQIIHSDPDA